MATSGHISISVYGSLVLVGSLQFWSPGLRGSRVIIFSAVFLMATVLPALPVVGGASVGCQGSIDTSVRGLCFANYWLGHLWAKIDTIFLKKVQVMQVGKCMVILLL